MSTSGAHGRLLFLAFAALALLLLLLAYIGLPDFFTEKPATAIPHSEHITADNSGEEAPITNNSLPDNPYAAALPVPPGGVGGAGPPVAYDPNWSPFPFDPTTANPSQKRTTAELEAAIQKLADVKNTDIAHEGSVEIRSAGEYAFPVLIAHLNDQTPANKCFQKAVAVPPGVVYPTIGDVCWDELHWQIMGAYRKGDPDYEPFGPGNIAKWLIAHAGQDLWQLRIAATEEVIATEKAKDRPNADFLALLESRLTHIKALAARAKSSDSR